MTKRIANRLSLLIGVGWLLYVVFRLVMHCDFFPTIGSGLYCNWKEFQTFYSQDFEPISTPIIIVILAGPSFDFLGLIEVDFLGLQYKMTKETSEALSPRDPPAPLRAGTPKASYRSSSMSPAASALPFGAAMVLCYVSSTSCKRE